MEHLQSMNLTRALLPALLCTTLSLAAPAQTPQTHGIATANMDTSVHPGNNFFLYANGGYVARTKLPADRASMGTFSTLIDRSSKQIAEIIAEATKANAPAGSDRRKIADLYHSYMDEAAIEAHGMASLKPHLDEISVIQTTGAATQITPSVPTTYLRTFGTPISSSTTTHSGASANQSTAKSGA